MTVPMKYIKYKSKTTINILTKIPLESMENKILQLEANKVPLINISDHLSFKTPYYLLRMHQYNRATL